MDSKAYGSLGEVIASPWGGGWLVTMTRSWEDYCWILTNEYDGQIKEGKGGLAKPRMMPRMAGRGRREMRARCVL